jgi:hypothetical protein
MNKLTKIAAASVVAMGLGFAGNASATPYSYGTAFNDISKWRI